MAIPILIAAAGLALMCVFLGERIHGCSPFITVLKSMVSLFFVMTAVAAVVISNGPRHYGVLIGIGLLCGLLGDIWLDLRYVVPSGEKVFTYAGMIAFGVGHIFYDAAIVSTCLPGAHWFGVLCPALIAAAGAALVALFSEKLFRVQYGKYKILVVIYSGILISLTAYAAEAVRYYHSSAAPLMLLAGGILFMLSDGILNAIYFGENKNRPADIFFNHLLYYLAQFTIALSVCFI